jgi:hypothetical protein
VAAIPSRFSCYPVWAARRLCAGLSWIDSRGRSVAFLTLEYRYRLHPNIQAVPFFDEGQIFDRTADLEWTNWHRNYGFGFRFRLAGKTLLRIEYGRSSEGGQFHLIFGDRERPPLRGPIRYGAYKR